MTKDGYELREGDTFWMYVQEKDDFIVHTALAIANGYVYYDKTEGDPDDDIFGRVLESDVWYCRQIPYSKLQELASRMDDMCECCCDECPDDLETSILWMVDTAYDLGRRSA